MTSNLASGQLYKGNCKGEDEMIISASRRTDIPALYPEWLVNRLLAGEVLVPNPYNRKKVSRIQLSPEVVDCLVFWTKNPEPMLPYLKMIDMLDYRYYFQMTITDYEEDVEPGLPSTEESMASFVLLSERLGKERVDFRFDPILLSDKYTISYHLEKFDMMCDWLHKYTSRCIFSFVDAYKGSPYLELEQEDMQKIAEGLSKIAGKYKLPLYTCAEKIELEQYGIRHAACIDREKVQKIAGYKIDAKKDSGQRKECGCCESIDIGMYDTCVNGCKYCYATAGLESAKKKNKLHNPRSPILISRLKGDEEIIDKRIQSAKDMQLSLFDFF